MKYRPTNTNVQNVYRVRRFSSELDCRVANINLKEFPATTILMQVMRTVNAVGNTVIHNASLNKK